MPCRANVLNWEEILLFHRILFGVNTAYRKNCFSWNPKTALNGPLSTIFIYEMDSFTKLSDFGPFSTVINSIWVDIGQWRPSVSDSSPILTCCRLHDEKILLLFCRLFDSYFATDSGTTRNSSRLSVLTMSGEPRLFPKKLCRIPYSIGCRSDFGPQ